VHTSRSDDRQPHDDRCPGRHPRRDSHRHGRVPRAGDGRRCGPREGCNRSAVGHPAVSAPRQRQQADGHGVQQRQRVEVALAVQQPPVQACPGSPGRAAWVFGREPAELLPAPYPVSASNPCSHRFVGRAQLPSHNHNHAPPRDAAREAHNAIPRRQHLRGGAGAQINTAMASPIPAGRRLEPACDLHPPRQWCLPAVTGCRRRLASDRSRQRHSLRCRRQREHRGEPRGRQQDPERYCRHPAPQGLPGRGSGPGHAVFASRTVDPGPALAVAATCFDGGHAATIPARRAGRHASGAACGQSSFVPSGEPRRASARTGWETAGYYAQVGAQGHVSGRQGRLPARPPALGNDRGRPSRAVHKASQRRLGDADLRRPSARARPRTAALRVPAGP